MPFFQSEPVEKASAVFVWTGPGEPGFFAVEAEGNAPKFTSGVQLVRDPQWIGGLKVDVMGWTGPLVAGQTQSYKVTGRFAGEYAPKIIVAGSNKIIVVEVEQLPQAESDAYVKAAAEAK